VPTIAETVGEYDLGLYSGLWAPAGTPREIIDYLNGHVRAVVADPDFRKRMIDLGGEPATCSPEELDARLKSDVEMWAGVVKKAGLSPN
jgi:tripartite-type tricarboxylate transporter receptor subunit TctC